MISLLPGVPALVIEKASRTLVVADLHLSPSGLTDREAVRTLVMMTLESLLKSARAVGASRLVIAGDVKDTISYVPRILLTPLREGFERLADALNEVLVVRGNHDGQLEEALPQRVPVLSRLELGDIVVVHGHSRLDTFARFVISAHIHPVFLKVFKSHATLAKCWLLARAEVEDTEFTWLCIPAFSRTWGFRVDTLTLDEIARLIPVRNASMVSLRVLSLDLLLLDSRDNLSAERV